MALARKHLWLLLLVGSVVIDFAARLMLDFDMQRVVPFEGALFGAVALLLVVIAKRWRAGSSRVRRVEGGLAVAYGLGAIRSTLWAAGVTVATANLIVLGIGGVVAIGFIGWRRLSRGGGRAT